MEHLVKNILPFIRFLFNQCNKFQLDSIFAIEAVSRNFYQWRKKYFCMLSRIFLFISNVGLLLFVFIYFFVNNEMLIFRFLNFLYLCNVFTYALFYFLFNNKSMIVSCWMLTVNKVIFRDFVPYFPRNTVVCWNFLLFKWVLNKKYNYKHPMVKNMVTLGSGIINKKNHYLKIMAQDNSKF